MTSRAPSQAASATSGIPFADHSSARAETKDAADRLFYTELASSLHQAFCDSFSYARVPLSVTVQQSLNSAVCPFASPGARRCPHAHSQYTLRNLRNGASITLTSLAPHLIGVHHCLQKITEEGEVPGRLFDVLGIKSPSFIQQPNITAQLNPQHTWLPLDEPQVKRERLISDSVSER